MGKPRYTVVYVATAESYGTLLAWLRGAAIAKFSPATEARLYEQGKERYLMELMEVLPTKASWLDSGALRDDNGDGVGGAGVGDLKKRVGITVVGILVLGGSASDELVAGIATHATSFPTRKSILV